MPIMHRINDAIVRDGKVVLCDLPFADGQHVQILVARADEQPEHHVPIDAVRETLKGGVGHFDDPFEPIIPAEEWEMLK